MHSKYLSHLFHRWADSNTLVIELLPLIPLVNLIFALGKLPLNKKCRDNFPVLKPLLLPQYIRKCYKCPNILETHCNDAVNTGQTTHL